MHILLIHQAFSALDEAGGTRHIEMARALTRHGHQVTIIASPVSYLTGSTRSAKMAWCEKEIPADGITILRTFTYKALHKNFIHRVFSFLSFMFSSFWVGLGVKNVDVVWGTSPPIFQGWTAWLLARLKRARFLLEIRDLWPAFAIAIGVLKNRTLIHLSLWLERFLYLRADQLVVNSPGFIEHINSRGGRNIRLIPNGADPELFAYRQTDGDLRVEQGWHDRFVVLYAGAHGISNDLETVLLAADILKMDARILFVLVGDGKEKSNLQALAARMMLNNVVFLPPVAKTGMAKVLAASDACIAILKPLDWYKTTYPNKVFDYMAAGRPVILAIDGVSRQVVESAGAGIFVTPGNPQELAQAVLRLADDPQTARQMGMAGRAYILQNLNREKIADDLNALLNEILRQQIVSR